MKITGRKFLLRFTDSDYPFGIFKLFLSDLKKKNYQNWTTNKN